MDQAAWSRGLGIPNFTEQRHAVWFGVLRTSLTEALSRSCIAFMTRMRACVPLRLRCAILDFIHDGVSSLLNAA